MSQIPQHLRQTFLLAMGVSVPLGGCGPTDADGDGVVAEDDCDDTNPAVYPGVAEICDNVDNNCDGVVDADAIDRKTWFVDADSDGFGDPTQSLLACAIPDGAVEDKTDCAPDDATIHPEAEELTSDRVDNDCDGMVDEVDCGESTVATSGAQVRTSRGRTPLAFCVDRPEDGSACPAPKDLRADRLVTEVVGRPSVATYPGGTTVRAHWFVNDPICGPDAGHTESCCYVFRAKEVPGLESVIRSQLSPKAMGGVDVVGGGPSAKPVHGRPLMVDGRARVASVYATQAWTAELHWEPAGLSSKERSQLARRWQQAAQYEHASVASFARFVMDLMALGAPPELLLAAVTAQADEVRHARDCFSVASCFAGRAVGPGTVDLDGVVHTEVTPERVLVETIADACINETLAAAEAGWLSARAGDVTLAGLLCRISEDESRHAVLGWQTVQWLVSTYPELSDLAQRTFDRLDRTAWSSDVSSDDEWMAAWGSMPTERSGELQARIWAEVIRPCAHALLNPRRT